MCAREDIRCGGRWSCIFRYRNGLPQAISGVKIAILRMMLGYHCMTTVCLVTTVIRSRKGVFVLSTHQFRMCIAASEHPPWRNWLARSTVNREVGGSSPPGGAYLLLLIFFHFWRSSTLTVLMNHNHEDKVLYALFHV